MIRELFYVMYRVLFVVFRVSDRQTKYETRNTTNEEVLLLGPKSKRKNAK